MRTLIVLIFTLTSLYTYSETPQYDSDQAIAQDSTKTRKKKYSWGYIDRAHSVGESARHIMILYGATWLLYPVTQPDVFKTGSWKEYKHNFGQLTFDRDEPFWNWFVHPISGSQLYLFYRANGYDRTSAFAMSAISSTLFEFTVEVYTEPASIQDLYQTPTLGAVLGLGLENLSMYLLNTGNLFGRIFGHFINPSTLFGFYEGKVLLIPDINLDKNNRKGALSLRATF